jgi:uncharacterized membrane protein YbhN (UPF0104 family)
VANQVARGRGWHALLRAAAPGGDGVPQREAIGAWVAGAGAGGIASARGGDAVRVLLVRRRLGRGSCPMIAGTLVAEGAGELAIGAVLLVLLLALGVAPAVEASAPSLSLAAGVIAALVALAVTARRSAALRRLAGRVGQGCAGLRSPGRYARQVLPWQAASRLLRAAGVWCFLMAFALPATPEAVLLVMAAQCGGRLLPFAPASVGAGAAVLATTFGPVTGTAVSVAGVTAFYVGVSALLTLVGAVLTLAICARAVGARRVGVALRPPVAEAART